MSPTVTGKLVVQMGKTADETVLVNITEHSISVIDFEQLLKKRNELFSFQRKLNEAFVSINETIDNLIKISS